MDDSINIEFEVGKLYKVLQWIDNKCEIGSIIMLIDINSELHDDFLLNPHVKNMLSLNFLIDDGSIVQVFFSRTGQKVSGYLEKVKYEK